jgi:nucleoside-diphosphate-sugar epimerase
LPSPPPKTAATAAPVAFQLVAQSPPVQLVAQSPPVYPTGAEYYPVYSEFVSWDELHTLTGRNIGAIIHLAGKAHDTRNTAAEQEYFDINLGLTQKIFEFFLQSGAKKFIFFSSVKAAADTVQGDSLTETVEPSPGTPYGRSKLAAENYLLDNSLTLNFKL